MNQEKILSALFYACASSLITIVNKIVLTTFKFPSFQLLFLGQQCAILMILQIAKWIGFVQFPSRSKVSVLKLFPLPLIFGLNALSGLGGTQAVSLPMLTVLRRFSVLMTMFGEYLVLGVEQSMLVQLSVYAMIIGAILASLNDLAFNSYGYILIIVNNILTAAYGVYTKERLHVLKDFGKYGVLYYNSLVIIFPATVFALLTGQFNLIWTDKNQHEWFNYKFLLYFLTSCVMGCVLNASVVLCTYYNSALTTSIIGCLKNVIVTYIGMFIGGDYIFSLINFLGINISILGSFLYTYVILWPKKHKS